MYDLDGQEGLCDFRNDEREALRLKGKVKTNKKGKSQEHLGRLLHQVTLAQKVLRCNCVEMATW